MNKLYEARRRRGNRNLAEDIRAAERDVKRWIQRAESAGSGLKRAKEHYDQLVANATPVKAER